MAVVSQQQELCWESSGDGAIIIVDCDRLHNCLVRKPQPCLPFTFVKTQHVCSEWHSISSLSEAAGLGHSTGTALRERGLGSWLAGRKGDIAQGIQEGGGCFLSCVCPQMQTKTAPYKHSLQRKGYDADAACWCRTEATVNTIYVHERTRTFTF